MNELIQDLKYGARMLVKNPVFAVIAVVTMALGIGANAVIFSVVNSVLLEPLPYRDPERLVRIYSEFPTMNLQKFWVSGPELKDIRRDTNSWESIGAWSPGGVNITKSDGESIRVNSASVTRELIDLLGVAPIKGRAFAAEEDRAGGPRVALISYGLWQKSFASQPDIIGKQIKIEAQQCSIIGIMPKGYVFPPGSNEATDVWVPLQLDFNATGRGGHFLNLIGKLKQGVTKEQALSEIKTLAAVWKSEKRANHLIDFRFHPIFMLPLQEDVVGSARLQVLMLLCAVGFVLLIACANIAGLLSARAEARNRELVVRVALGAGRWRLFRQFITEGAILVLIGVGIGLLAAWMVLNVLPDIAPDSVPRLGEIGIDLTVILFTVGLSALSTFIFALAPMIQLSNSNIAHRLHSSRGTKGSDSQLLRKVLVVSEIALALILVIGSGLMIRAFWKLRNVELGFKQGSVLTFKLRMPESAYKSPDRLRFITNLREKIESIPGIKSATYATGLPPLRPILANDTGIEGYQAAPNEPDQPNIDYWNTVGEDYFKTMGIRTLEGRAFEKSDRPKEALRVAVINQAMARRYWKGSPVGKRISPNADDTQPVWFSVIGVVEDTKNGGVDKPAGTELYFLGDQYEQVNNIQRTMSFAVSTSGDPDNQASAIRSALFNIDPSIPAYDMQSLSDVVDLSLTKPRFISILMSSFSVIALLLASIGIYGVMSYAVTQRTQEIGVRMALGARLVDILKMIFKQGAEIVVVGIVIGLVGAFMLTKLMENLLFQVSATDPITFFTVVAILTLTSVLACYIPARRAAKVDPMIALRSE